jgi:1-acyl-sn-glycerol-3-phosphate acyltransferase
LPTESHTKGFAKKLCEDLKARGVSCWFFPEDAKVGSPLWREIGKARRGADKVIITCSADSLVRDGLLKEIEETADDDPSRLVPISLDNIWREQGFLAPRGARDLKPFLLNQIYADFVGWEKDEKTYQKGLEKLLKGLEREEATKGG